MTLDVEDTETLASLIDRAARELGIPPDEYFRSEYTMVDLALREGDDRPRIRALVVLNKQGEAMWNAWDLRLISYGEFVRAVEAGALPGDPRQLYLIWHQKGGNGVIPDWPDLLEGLDIAWEVVKALGVVGGAYYTVKVMAVDPLRKRLKRGRDAIARNAPAWALRPKAWTPCSAIELGQARPSPRCSGARSRTPRRRLRHSASPATKRQASGVQAGTTQRSFFE